LLVDWTTESSKSSGPDRSFSFTIERLKPTSATIEANKCTNTKHLDIIFSKNQIGHVPDLVTVFLQTNATFPQKKTRSGQGLFELSSWGSCGSFHDNQGLFMTNQSDNPEAVMEGMSA